MEALNSLQPLGGVQMNRRQFTIRHVLPLLGASMVASQVQALNLDALSNKDAASGLKGALEKGALAAIGTLGVNDGFMGNPKVRIALPGYLNDAAQLMKKFGQGQKVDELMLSMNRAAETAVPLAKNMLVSAIQSMSVNDAKSILKGGDTAATEYFNSKTREPLTQQFLPVISQATSKAGMADKYKAVAGKASSLGLIKPQEASLETYVTGKALDGLFWMMGEEEKKIRKDPMGTGSDLLGKVFGALK